MFERRDIYQLAGLFTALGLGDEAAYADMQTLTGLATHRAQHLRRRIDELIERNRALEYGANINRILNEEYPGRRPAAPAPAEAIASPPPVQAPQHPVVREEDQGHAVQWRLVDENDGVVVRGEWFPQHLADASRKYLENEQAIRPELRLQRVVRCTIFNVTSVAEEL